MQGRNSYIKKKVKQMFSVSEAVPSPRVAFGY